MDRATRERRAAELRRMGIELLADQYRNAFRLSAGEIPIHPQIREVMMRAILEREYPEFDPRD